MSKENILRLEHVTMQFGGVVAVNDLSLDCLLYTSDAADEL